LGRHDHQWWQLGRVIGWWLGRCGRDGNGEFRWHPLHRWRSDRLAHGQRDNQRRQPDQRQ
ncbi:MAG: hypothetical protein ACK55I_00645, partial [bacterium]